MLSTLLNKLRSQGGQYDAFGLLIVVLVVVILVVVLLRVA